MPRNGDGSSDNGPFPEAERPITHGNGPDPRMQHTTKKAPPPEPEKGEALPGLPASGGGADPTHQRNPFPEDK
ncbi:hypothetical protein DM02DRAFT_650112 [Periconia macrospinosa]|uniref:Uncharacterized protein n=1 Tax=Periconia macrospinosa TaxID=97972 RepID=A0A2V1E807_9PLEO|nr:hypothetical protein DM02DRAFT_650112 [Periconia macrospinosa]